MQLQKNYEYLLSISADIEKCVNASPSFALFNKDKIDSFYANNKDELDAAGRSVKELLDKYVERDADGKHITISCNGRSQRKFKSDEDRASYNRFYQDFIKWPVTITI